MLARTDQPYAPWHLIEANSKRYARVKVIETVIERIEAGMRQWGMEPPPPLEGDWRLTARAGRRLARSWRHRLGLRGPAGSAPAPTW